MIIYLPEETEPSPEQEAIINKQTEAISQPEKEMAIGLPEENNTETELKENSSMPEEEKSSLKVENRGVSTEDEKTEQNIKEKSVDNQKPESQIKQDEMEPEEKSAVSAPEIHARKSKIFHPGKIRPSLPLEESVETVVRTSAAVTITQSKVSDAHSTEDNELTSVVENHIPEQEVVRIVAAPRDAELMMGEALTLGTSFEGQESDCIAKQQKFVLFCLQDVIWPEHLEPFFETHGIMHRGAQAIVRFDGKRLTHAHSLFLKSGLKDIEAFFEARYGPPLESFRRIVTPFAGRPVDNQTYVWRRNSSKEDEEYGVVLEVRGVDDSRGGFPDMEHGLVRLYGVDSLPIFPRVSPREMMLVKFAVN